MAYAQTRGSPTCCGVLALHREAVDGLQIIRGNLRSVVSSTEDCFDHEAAIFPVQRFEFEDGEKGVIRLTLQPFRQRMFGVRHRLDACDAHC